MTEGHRDVETSGHSIGLVVQGKINHWAEADDVVYSVSSGGQNHLAHLM